MRTSRHRGGAAGRPARFMIRMTMMMDSIDALTGRIRTWFERTPKAQEAYRRLSADLDTVVDRVESATVALRERVTPIIDPSKPTPAADPDRKDPAS